MGKSKKLIGINFVFYIIQIYSPHNNIYAGAPRAPRPEICYSLLGKEYVGVLIITGEKKWINRFVEKITSETYETDCSQADKQYSIFLIIVFLGLSGLGYLGYKKYKAKKLMSNIETKNTSPVNPE